MHTHSEQWAADTAVPGEQLGVRCLAQGFHLSRGPFEPTTSGYKSDALSIRATTAQVTFIYIALYTIQIVSSQLYSVKKESSVSIMQED